MSRENLGFIKKGQIFNRSIGITVLHQEKTLTFLVEWDPAVLSAKVWDSDLPLLEIAQDASFEVFRMLFEHGMVHYPEDMGFLFPAIRFNPYVDITYVDITYVDIFKAACDRFGEQKVNELVTGELSKYTRGDTERFQNLLFAVASKENMSLDALYFLCPQNPSALIPLNPNSRDTQIRG